MTREQHPITPPSELMQQWWDGTHGALYEFEAVVTQAARWGADQELKECCEWVSQWRCMVGGNRPEVGLRAARRPEPPSLKEKASQIVDCLIEGDCLNDDDAITLRQVVESLPS